MAAAGFFFVCFVLLLFINTVVFGGSCLALSLSL